MRLFSIQRSDRADRTIVADYSGDDSTVPHMGVSNMILGAVVLVVLVPIEWVVTALILYFSFKQ